MLGSLFEGEDEEVDVAGSSSSSSVTSRSSFPTGEPLQRRYAYKPLCFEQRPESGFVGLLNQGATCYLNSLIQALYMTPELRAGLYSLSPEDLQVTIPPKSEPDTTSGENKEEEAGNQEEATAEKEEENEKDRKQREEKQREEEKRKGEEERKTKEEEEEEEREETIQFLVEMGFDREQARRAAKRFPSVEQRAQAVEWLFSPEALTANDGDKNKHEEREYEDGEEGLVETKGVSHFNEENMMPDLLALTEEDEDLLQDAFSIGGAFFEEEDQEQHKDKEKEEKNDDATNVDSKETKKEDGEEKETKKKPKKQKTTKKRKIPMQLQRLFAKLQLANLEAASTEDLTKSFGWRGSQMFQQHDVHELNRVLFEAIERSLRNTPMQNLINDLYRGVTVNKIICTQCNRVSEREEPFQDVTLTVAGFPSVEASLYAATDYERLCGDNQYYCEQCQCKVDALKGATFRSLPSILILSLSRFMYDWERDCRIKNTEKFSFPLLLDMSKYEEGGAMARAPADSTSKQEQQQKEANQQPKETEEEKKNDAESVTIQQTEETVATRSSNNKSNNNQNKKRRNKKRRQAENGEEDDDKEKESYELEWGAYDPASPHLYELFCVVIHRGSNAGFGHYHAYIRDVTSTPPSEEERKKQLANGWFDFDDSKVTPISVERLATQYAGKSECAYMLIYRRCQPEQALTSTKEKRASSSSPKTAAEVPPHLLAEVEKTNQELDKERGEYLELLQQVDVLILTSEDLTVGSDGALYKRYVKTKDEGKRQKERVIVLPKTTSVKAFKERILEVWNNLHLQEEEKGKADGELKLRLDEIKTKDGGGKVLFERTILSISNDDDDELSNKSLEELSITEPISVLVWDGVHVGAARNVWNPPTKDKDSTTNNNVNKANYTLHVTHYVREEQTKDKDVENEHEKDAITPLFLLHSGVWTRATYEVQTSASSTLASLKQELAKLSGIPSSSQANRLFLCREGTPGQPPVPLLRDELSLKELGIIFDDDDKDSPSSVLPSLLSLEEWPLLSSSLSPTMLSQVTPDEDVAACLRASCAWAVYEARASAVQVFVTDAYTGLPESGVRNSSSFFFVEVPKDATVAQLKAAIIPHLIASLTSSSAGDQEAQENEEDDKKRKDEAERRTVEIFKLSNNYDACRLRRTLPGGSPGSLFRDESLRLNAAGIGTGDRVIVERNAVAADAGEDGMMMEEAVNEDGIPLLSIRFAGAFASKDHPVTITVPKNATIAECKKEMASVFELNPERYRLRRTDIWSNPAALFYDEEATLAHENVLDGDTLWLEEGKPPVKGQISLRCQLYVTDSLLPEDPSNQQQKVEEGASSKESTALPGEQSSEILPIEEQVKQLGSPAFHLSSYFTTGGQLEDNCPFFVTPLCDIETVNTATLVDLKTLLLGQAALNHVQSPEHLRLWHGGTLLQDDNKPLKRLHLSDDSIITVQVLTNPDPSSTTESNKQSQPPTLLYVYRRDSKEQRFVLPADEFWFNANDGEGVSAAEVLAESMSQRYNIPREYLTVIKYFPFKRTWAFLAAPSSTPPTQEESEAKEEETKQPPQQQQRRKRKKAATNNKKGGALKLRNGDIVIVSDVSEDPGLADQRYFTQSLPPLTKVHRLDGAHRKGGKGGKAERVKETGITIFVDDDYF